MTNKETSSILTLRDLEVRFNTASGFVNAVDNVSFDLKEGHTLGIAGESGCGKSVTALSIIRLLPKPVSRISRGIIEFKGENLLDIPLEKMQGIRGEKISMIFQEPMTALNPVQTVGRQIREVYELHFDKLKSDIQVTKAIEMLEKVGIPDPEQVMGKYPHQLSGGMRQRVMIAMALACEPDILIADEPTTALDVTVQAQILDLIKNLKAETGMSVILITHDLGVIAENCDDVVVMYAGRVAEVAPAEIIFSDPAHPYTKGLLASIPSRAKIAKSHLPTIKGMVPSLGEMPDGCRFADRCPMAEERCRKKTPQLLYKGENRSVACHLV